LFVGEVIRASLWHINFIHKHVPVALSTRTVFWLMSGCSITIIYDVPV